MIDPKTYIESGKLEEYVLGLGTADLMQEVECMARVFPEIKDEIKSLQASFENIALDSQVTPPDKVKNNILQALTEDQDVSKNNIKETANTISSKPGSSKWLPLLGLFMILSLGISYWFFSQNSKLNQLIELIQSKATQSEKTIDSLRQNLQSTQSELDIILHPNRMAIKMSGTKLYPEGLATIYWSPDDHQVYVSSGTLPTPPSDKQFQLWAIVDGKPIDLGVLSKAAPSGIQQMKSIDHPTTFAVTLEPDGGSVTPTLEHMYVAGNVTGL